MFNISLTDLTERRAERLEWHSEPQDVHLCIMKGLDEVRHETHYLLQYLLQSKALACSKSTRSS